VATNRQLAAIMFTDVAGFTEATQRDEKAALRLLDELQEAAAPLFEGHHGRQVKSMGDGLLVEFPDALNAVECAVDLQRALADRNAGLGAIPLRLRIGVHLGDVERRGADIVGDAVNVASRVEPLAEPGGICLSEHVAALVRNKVSYRLENIGTRTLKGVRDPVGVFRVILPWLDAGPIMAGGAPRLAVLPLANISPDAKDEYFADGLTEELIAVLSRLKGLRVIARTSVSQYKTAPKSIRQIGAELGVGAVLEGSVRRSGDRLRITLQLIDVSTEEHRWAESYDREMKDVFEIQADVAERTAHALRLELIGSEREAVRKAPMRDLEAYDAFLQGIAAFQRTADAGWTRPGVERAAAYFEATIAREPHSAAPYAHLANLLIAGMGECLAKKEVEGRVRDLVASATRLGPDESDAHTARGNFALQFERDWGRAEEEFRRAISLNPSSMQAHAWYGILLFTQGRFPEAVQEFRAAGDLDPLFHQTWHWRIRALDHGGNPEEAIAYTRDAISKDPVDPYLHVQLGTLLLRQGRLDEARQEAALASGPIAGSARAIGRAELLAALGDPSEARTLIAKWEGQADPQYLRPLYVARLLVTLGRLNDALTIIEQDSSDGDQSLWIDFRQRAFDPIRTDPRFVALLRQMKLPE
jgi:adenylate cyclase